MTHPGFWSKYMGVFAVVAAAAAAGCSSDGSPVESGSQSASVGSTLSALITNLRHADIKATGGFARSFARHLDTVALREAGEDVVSQRSALKNLFGVDLPPDVTPREFVGSFKRALDLQYEPIARAVGSADDTVRNIAHVDGVVADLLGEFPDIVKTLEASGIPGHRAMDLLVAVAWRDVGKSLDPAYLESIPRVATLLKSEAFTKALAEVPEAARADYRNKFMLQALCADEGSLRSLESDGNLKEAAAKRVVTLLDDVGENASTSLDDQWKAIVESGSRAPRSAEGALLAALYRARSGSLEFLAGSSQRLDGGLVDLAHAAKRSGKPMGSVIYESVLATNSRNLMQLRTMALSRGFGGLLVSKFAFFKRAMVRAQVTESILKSFVVSANAADDFVEVLPSAFGKSVRVSSVDEFFRVLDSNWDELYAAARLEPWDAPARTLIDRLASVFQRFRTKVPGLSEAPLVDEEQVRRAVGEAMVAGSEADKRVLAVVGDSATGGLTPKGWDAYFAAYDEMLMVSGGPYVSMTLTAERALPRVAVDGAGAARILDLGAGSGNVTTVLANAERQVTAIEQSAGAIAKGAAKVEAIGKTGAVNFIEGSITDTATMAKASGKFDGLVIQNVAYTIPIAERTAMLRNAISKLKSGAVLVFTDPVAGVHSTVESFIGDLGVAALNGGRELSVGELQLVAVVNSGRLTSALNKFQTTAEMKTMFATLGLGESALISETPNYLGRCQTLVYRVP